MRRLVFRPAPRQVGAGRFYVGALFGARSGTRSVLLVLRYGRRGEYRLSAKTYRSPNIRNNLETFAIPDSFSISQHDTYNRTRRKAMPEQEAAGR